MKRSISEVADMIKRFLLGDFFMVLVIILVGLASFGLGRLSAERGAREPVRIEYPANLNTASVGKGVKNSLIKTSSATREGYFVGSKNGSKYYFPWCPGVKRIKSENLVKFTTRTKAEDAGYTPAVKCKGL